MKLPERPGKYLKTPNSNLSEKQLSIARKDYAD
jgi:hypothetical protein